MKHLSIIIILIYGLGAYFGGLYVGANQTHELTSEQRNILPYLIEKLEWAQESHLWYAENPDRWYSHHRTVEWEYMWVDIYEETIGILEAIK